MGTDVYIQRRPENTALYNIVSDNYETFQQYYNEKFGEKYGFFRPEIEREISKYSKCGIYKYGFARIKCQNDKCGEEYLLPFSCKSRGVCPSCIQKYALELEQLLVDEILREVPMRHIILTIPTRLRKNFVWHRECLNDLSRIAWKTLKEFFQTTLKTDGTPGAVQSIETGGQYLDVNPHVHVLVTDGVFSEEGEFYAMPHYGAKAKLYMKTLWEKKICEYCVMKGFVTKYFVNKLLWQRHTGFSVYAETKIDYKRDSIESEKAIRHIIRYIAKPPIAESRLTYSNGKVLYKGNFHKGKMKNFETYEPDVFLAAFTNHIPKYRQKLMMMNYYGMFSNRTRGYNKAHGNNIDKEYPVAYPEITVEQRAFRRSWAILIKKVWEVDPLQCRNCGTEMKIMSVVTDSLDKERILREMGLWSNVKEIRGPPENTAAEIEYIPDDGGWPEAESA
jgi:hypothetical protein